ncbi:MAG: HAD family hydrolase [Oscillospiraceae bacterium]|nr:HAD family hydrolase [Oscillospiraceae bacterium]
MDTILLDLDGTLLPFRQEAFVAAYFAALKTVFADLGLDAERGVKAVWAGTKAMVNNDGTVSNALRFWDTFGGVMSIAGESLKKIERACDAFYQNGFNTVREVMTPTGIPSRLVRALTGRGFTVALATNPLFPACAVETRLAWIGLTPNDFALVTDYYNCSNCKPSLEYYRHLLNVLGKEPGQCLMAGNSAAEDICAGELGIETFLVTDFSEDNEAPYRPDYRGTLSELETFLNELA